MKAKKGPHYEPPILSDATEPWQSRDSGHKPTQLVRHVG